jgi:hypothetical protein
LERGVRRGGERREMRRERDEAVAEESWIGEIAF